MAKPDGDEREGRDKPTVHYGSTGVSRVDPADILRSRVGREEIEKAARVAAALRLVPAIGGIRRPSSK